MLIFLVVFSWAVVLGVKYAADEVGHLEAQLKIRGLILQQPAFGGSRGLGQS
jgi:hypothetical protein